MGGAARIFPSLVCLEPDMPSVKENREAYAKLKTLTIPILICFSKDDPQFKSGFFQRQMKRDFRGAQGMPHRDLEGNHFVQDDNPEGCVQCILSCLECEQKAKL